MRFDHPIHLTGIKGSGMASLACLLHDWGNTVTGADVPTHYFTQLPLEARRIPVWPFDAANLVSAGIAIYSPAYGPTHPERQAANERGVQAYSYPEFLGLLTQQMATISVAGTHGKTTTTSMLTAAWQAAGRDPSVIIGDGTGLAGSGPELLLESCEYRAHFLHYQPQDAILLNCDWDHPDYFSGLADVQAAFRTFAQQVKGQIVACGDDPNLMEALSGLNVVTYGFSATHAYCPADVVAGPDGARFTALHEGRPLVSVVLQVSGRHNVMNALAVVALAHQKGLDLQAIARGLAGFGGARRRFQAEQRYAGVLVDDYAHHPVEIAATIQAARERYPQRRIVACFQAHTFSRTEALLTDFAVSLSAADQVYLLDIFPSAREQRGDVTANDLATLIASTARMVERDSMALLARDALRSGAVVLMMGAGDIDQLKPGI